MENLKNKLKKMYQVFLSNKAIIAIILVMAISACSTSKPGAFDPKASVVLQPKQVNTLLPPIDLGDQPVLHKFSVDVPRVIGGERSVKNISKCHDLSGGVYRDKDNPYILRPKNKKLPDNFWDICGEWPQQSRSNIFLGLDQDNWNNLSFNLLQLKEYINRLISRITQENKRRKALVDKESRGLLDKNIKNSVNDLKH